MFDQNKIVQYITGNMAASDVEIFEKEVQQSEALKNEVDSYRQIWILTNQLEYSQRYTLDGWGRLSKSVKAPMKILGFDWRKMAASILLLAAFSFLFYTFTKSSDQSIVADGIENVSLTDQSSVVLENNSTLTIDKAFGTDNRHVFLDGKAYFDVSKNTDLFTVGIASGTISVLGTRFQVSSVGTNSFAIELYEGSISYESNRIKSKTIQLEPGQELYLDGNNVLQVRAIESSTHSIGAEQIVCYDKSLYFILNQIKMVYGLDFDINRRLLNEHYTVTLPSSDIKSCIQILSEISDRNFAVIDAQIIIK